jgi:hypothetical protein
MITVITIIARKCTVFWVVTSSNLVKDLCIGEIQSLQLQKRRTKKKKKKKEKLEIAGCKQSWRFRGTYILHLQRRKVIDTRNH